MRPRIRVDDDQQISKIAKTQRHETFFAAGVGIFTGQGEIVRENRDRLGEADPVSA